MDKNKQIAIDAIEAKSDIINDVSDAVWEYAELSLQEFKSAEKYCEVLEKEGFTVEKGICNIPTAFSASFGSGRPYIGLLAEYDALSGLSQKACCLKKEELVPGGDGHGCGHNMLGAGALAAALGVKAYLEKAGISGTVILYGCPGEEGGAAKAFMARDGLWKNLDAAITWHPGGANEVVTGSSNSCIQTQYIFRGVSAHAAGNPERGRSALDAVQLMNMGVEFLREHMEDRDRIHYAITNSGGISANVVQPKASVLYMVRSPHVSKAIKLQERVDKVAQGAAMMTETTVEKVFIDGTSNTIPNHVLEKVLYENFEALGVPTHTAEEYAFADELAKTYPGADQPTGMAAKFSLTLAEEVKKLQKECGHALNDFLMPLYQADDAYSPGSTDVADVSWLCPTGQIHVVSFANGAPGHSWQNVTMGNSDIGRKSVIHAGKVMAAATIDLFNQPETLAAAKAEFEKHTAEGFTSPIPADAVPVIPELN